MTSHEKELRLLALLDECCDPMISAFFDIDSPAMIDEKIRVLEALASGQTRSQINGYYDILEKMPQDTPGHVICWDI